MLLNEGDMFMNGLFDKRVSLLIVLHEHLQTSKGNAQILRKFLRIRKLRREYLLRLFLYLHSCFYLLLFFPSCCLLTPLVRSVLGHCRLLVQRVCYWLVLALIYYSFF